MYPIEGLTAPAGVSYSPEDLCPESESAKPLCLGGSVFLGLVRHGVSVPIFTADLYLSEAGGGVWSWEPRISCSTLFDLTLRSREGLDSKIPYLIGIRSWGQKGLLLADSDLCQWAPLPPAYTTKVQGWK